jgi:hypothetical protein
VCVCSAQCIGIMYVLGIQARAQDSDEVFQTVCITVVAAISQDSAWLCVVCVNTYTSIHNCAESLGVCELLLLALVAQLVV